MKPRHLSDVARAVRGLHLGDDVVVHDVVIDSRQAGPGSLFVAIPGERVDGARFVPEALERGAAAVLVRDGISVDGPAVFVRSANEALLALAADERRRSDATVIGITGANGKTSTKDLTASVVSVRWHTHASPASFNNEIGVPMTLLGAPPETEMIVAELGARHVGDVTFLSSIARPSIVVVTNVGLAHMEVFGSWEKIVEAGAEPIEALEPDGVAVLNVDDPVVAGYATRTGARVVTFGRADDADVRADDVVLDADGRASCTIAHGDERVAIRLQVPGEHMVGNALAAVAVGIEVGVGLADAAEAAANTAVSRWRMETFTTSEGVRVLNDAYNANPESMAAALRTARWMAGDGRLIAVLGTMAELGAVSLQEHERIGALTARLGVARLVTVGGQAEPIAVAALREGLEPDAVMQVDDVEAALAQLHATLVEGDLVLCKASRSAGLERVAEGLR